MNARTGLGNVLAFGIALSAAAVPVRAAGVKVIIENLAPDNGTWLTPFWLGFHDGSFDTHDLGAPASTELERLAEDGNTGPLSEAFALSGAGNAQATVISDEGIPPLAPGESATMTFILDGTDPLNRYFSFTSMVIPSNDAFVGNDTAATHQIFDGDGDFLGAFIMIDGTDVKDAGTEVNDELPEHTAFFGQMESDSGVDEDGVVDMHEGYMPPGSGGILDDTMFANADFTEEGYEVARITIVRSDTPVPAGPVSGVWDLDGSPYLLEGDVYVPSGETLVIEPGVTVFAQSWYALEVNGTLLAEGTEEQPITFAATPPGPGEPGWKGVRFVDGSSASEMSWCVVENGQVMAAEPFDRGGAVYVRNTELTMNQCTLRANHARDFGGGLYCESADVLVDRSTISDNSAGNNPSAYGGGICAVDSQLELIDSTIAGNSLYVFNTFSSSTARGGGVYLDNTDAMLEGNLIVNNEVDANGNVGTDGDGGGLALFNADPMLLNNTFSNNAATVNGGPQPAGALWCYQADPEIINTIFWGDSAGEIEIDEFGVMSELTISYCNLEGGQAGIVTNDNAVINFLEGNIDDDPMFVDAADGDYNLMEGSPCIDAGDPMSPLDPDGTVADIGALYFDQGVFGDVNGDGVVNTADLLQLLADWGPCPDCPSDLNGDGVVDTADLLALLAAWG